MDRKNTLILGLTASAMVLMGLLALIQLFYIPQNTFAVGQQNGGDYVVTTSRTANGEEALWVLDARTRNIGIYQYDNSLRQLVLRGVYPAQIEAATTPLR